MYKSMGVEEQFFFSAAKTVLFACVVGLYFGAPNLIADEII